LWSQAGAEVIRGSLLAIPIEESLLYVQPLYLSAQQGSLPELKRIIVVFGNRIAMEETLEQSLQRLFADGAAPPGTAPAALTSGIPKGVKELTQRALEHYERSIQFLRQGNWSAYGEELKKLESVLRGIQKEAG
jgi:hypothetical protein